MAVVLRDGRGSQRHRRRGLVRAVRGGGRPSGRPRIATAHPHRAAVLGAGVAVVLRDDRGSQPQARPGPEREGWRWRSSFGTTEDRNHRPKWARTPVAKWRSSFGTTEDRNLTARRPPEHPPRWRSSFGTTEDRNNPAGHGRHQGREWRSSFGTTEDRNAAALARITDEVLWRSSFGATEDRNTFRVGRGGQRRAGGGRASGRPRIATSAASASRRLAWRWRSPFELTEDRNLHHRLVGELYGIGVAVVLWDDRGSQPRTGDPP